MSQLPTHNEALSHPNPHASPIPPPEQLRSHETLAFLSSAHACNAPCRESEPTLIQTTRISDDSSFNSNRNSRRLPKMREQWWVSEMDEFLAASRLCREEAMACSLQTAEVHWPFSERENRKKNKHKSLSLACRALNVGTMQSWRGLKKLLSKQFMPFSNRDHRGLHHIHTTINKRSLKTLNVGGRKMDARLQVGANKCDFILSRKKLQGKENIEQNGKDIREPSSIDGEMCRSRLGSCEKNGKWQQGKFREGGIKNKVHILLSKASDVALEVCDILNLE